MPLAIQYSRYRPRYRSKKKNRQEVVEDDAVGDAVTGAVVEDNSSSTAPNSKPKIVMASPWLVDDDRDL